MRFFIFICLFSCLAKKCRGAVSPGLSMARALCSGDHTYISFQFSHEEYSAEEVNAYHSDDEEITNFIKLQSGFHRQI